MKELWAWMNGEFVGVWSIGRTGNHRFVYAPSWRESSRVRALSLSLPITSTGSVEGAVVENYFDNLLPDNDDIRKRLRTRFNVTRASAFALLQALGRDCVGAVQLLPPGTEPTGFNRIASEPLTEQAVERILQGLAAAEAGIGLQDDGYDFRISIAGAQEKTALLRVGGQWHVPTGATPTTHILKPPIGIVRGLNLDWSDSVENEWLCNQILVELGLPAAVSEIEIFGQAKALVVERFDRQWQADNAWIARLPQEDLCQANGVAAHHKYEAKGGPSMADCLRVLAGSDNFHEDGRHFLCAQLAFWLMAAIDGHAKNFSIFLLSGGRYRATPLYDVLSAWPIVGVGPHKLAYKKTRLAMAVHSKAPHYRLAEIQHRHWEVLAQKSGVENAWPAMLALVNNVDATLQRVQARLPIGFPVDMANAIFEGIRKHVDRFNGVPGAMADG